MRWQADVAQRATNSGSLGLPPPVVPVLCFIRGEWPLISPPRSFRGVRLEGTRSMKKLLMGGRALGDVKIGRLAEVLSRALPPR